jgi:hypothetical protein
VSVKDLGCSHSLWEKCPAPHVLAQEDSLACHRLAPLWRTVPPGSDLRRTDGLPLRRGGERPDVNAYVASGRRDFELGPPAGGLCFAADALLLDPHAPYLDRPGTFAEELRLILREFS